VLLLTLGAKLTCAVDDEEGVAVGKLLTVVLKGAETVLGLGSRAVVFGTLLAVVVELTANGELVKAEATPLPKAVDVDGVLVTAACDGNKIFLAEVVTDALLEELVTATDCVAKADTFEG